MQGIIVTVNLQGALEGAKKHVSRQKHSVKIKDSEYCTKVILHTDKEEVMCKRTSTIDSDVVNYWVSNNAPEWVSEKHWKLMNQDQRIMSYLSGLDEGYGVSYELLE